mgnify:CR=1 FL=1
MQQKRGVYAAAALTLLGILTGAALAAGTIRSRRTAIVEPAHVPPLLADVREVG